MTDIGRKAALAQSRAQLPVNAYFDESIYQLEQQHIFGQAARYIGQQKYVPELGDYRTLVQENNGRALIHNDHGIELISNVCRHRQAVMLGDIHQPNTSHFGNLNLANPKTGEHTGGNIVCPLHRWTYNNQGTLIGAPDFPESPCLNLNRYPTQNWQGSLFEGSRDIQQDLGFLTQRPEFDFSEYVLDKIELHECNYNWKTFIEVYLEDYHVAPFHPGLGQFVTCNDLQWEFKHWLSVQTVGVHQALKNPGSSIYQSWHDALLNYRQGEAPDFGAVWLAYYPTHMIELYPHTLVLSTLYPQGPQKTLNVVEFYYPEDIIHFEREFIEAQQAAYMETAIEDDEIAERMDAGRLALLKRGDNEVGPYQSPMEDGMQHFHEWYRSLISM